MNSQAQRSLDTGQSPRGAVWLQGWLSSPLSSSHSTPTTPRCQGHTPATHTAPPVRMLRERMHMFELFN